MKDYNSVFKSVLKSMEDEKLKEYLEEVPFRRSVSLFKSADDAPPLGEHEALFTMTDSGVDRDNDVILAAGVDTDWFHTYGSILWGHRADEPRFVLGAPTEVLREESRIMVRAKFASEDVNPDGARVYRMITSGVVKAMSVGVMIREYSEAKDRDGYMPLNITRSELIETSVTPVPINPRAVLQAVPEGKGSDEAKAVAEIFEEVADTSEEVKAASIVTGLSEDQIKNLIHKTVEELFGQKMISVQNINRASADPAIEALDYFARLAAQ